MPHPRGRRGFQIQIEATAPLGRTKAVKDPLERDAHTADRCASLMAMVLKGRCVGMRQSVAGVVAIARIVTVRQCAQHGRCGHGNIERYALASGQIAKPRRKGSRGGWGGSDRAGGIRGWVGWPPGRARRGRRAEICQCCRASERTRAVFLSVEPQYRDGRSVRVWRQGGAGVRAPGRRVHAAGSGRTNNNESDALFTNKQTNREMRKGPNTDVREERREGPFCGL